MVEPVAIGDEIVSAGFERARWIEARPFSLSERRRRWKDQARTFFSDSLLLLSV